MERAVLLQGLAPAPGPGLAAQPLPAARPLHYHQEGHRQPPFDHQTGQGLAPQIPRQATREERPAPSSAPTPPVQPPASTSLSQDIAWPPADVLPPPPPPPPAVPDVPRSTAYRKRKRGEAGGPEKEPRKVYLCSLCGQPKRRETGHSRLGGVAHCTVASGGKSVEAWLAEQRDEVTTTLKSVFALPDHFLLCPMSVCICIQYITYFCKFYVKIYVNGIMLIYFN